MGIVKSEIKKKLLLARVEKYPKSLLSDVLEFCKQEQILRTGLNCAEFYENKYSEKQCNDAIEYLFLKNQMGAYCRCEGSPQGIMREYILDSVDRINKDSMILEVGPGDNPLFDENEYKNWYSCDYNYSEGAINFSGKIWGKNKYKHIVKGSWENLTEVRNNYGEELSFDLVCGSHSFEHNHRPVKALVEARKVLKSGGHIVVFVPDGYSTWPGNYDKTHTLYFDEQMAQDFFEAAGGYTNVICKSFRINMDLAIIATKI